MKLFGFTENNKITDKTRLLVHEWLAVVALVSILLVFSFYGIYSDWNSEVPSNINSTQIEVSIEGAVKVPGKYTLPSNSKIKDLIKVAEAEENASYSKRWADTFLVDGEHIVIAKSGDIRIKIEGAVENPGWIFIPSNTRMNELKNRLIFKENAKLSALNKKRRLQDGEILNIPFYKRKNKANPEG